MDLTMSREQWSRFTDFGVTLFDSAGRQIEKQPLNYAFGRLQAALPEGHGDMPVELALFPGFADTTGDEAWTVRASIRLYADSAVTLAAGGHDEVGPHRRTRQERGRSVQSAREPLATGRRILPAGRARRPGR